MRYVKSHSSTLHSTLHNILPSILRRILPGINPIIVKELRSRMRGARAFLTLTGILLFMGGVSYLLYRMALATSTYSSAPLSPQIGQSLFITLAFIELLMVCTIAPAVTAGAISGEQEKLTYEMLLATPLRPASVLWGKLISALSYVLLLIFAAVPMASLFFIFGGVTTRDMLKALFIVIVIAVAFGVLGLFMSALLKRTSRATVLSYMIVALLSFGTIFVYVALSIITRTEPPRWILVPSPISALFSAIAPTTSYGGSPLSILSYLGMGMGGNLSALTGSTISYTSIPRPIYHYSLPFYGILAVVLYLLSSRLILPTRRWRIGWKNILMVLVLFLVIGGAVTTAFFATTDRYEKAIPVQESTPIFTGGDRSQVVIAPPVNTGSLPMLTPTPVPAFSAWPTATATPFAYPYPQLPMGITINAPERAVIYAEVIHQIYTELFATSPTTSTVYLVRNTDDSAGDPLMPVGELQNIPEALQGMIVDLAEIPSQIQWIGSPTDVMPDPLSGAVAERGAILTLGNIYYKKEQTVLVSASLFVSKKSELRKTYALELEDGIWKITGEASIPSGTGNSDSSLDEQTQAAIYAAAVRQLFVSDYFQNQPPAEGAIILLYWTDDRVGGGFTPQGNPVELSDVIQREISVLLSDLTPGLTWTDSLEHIHTDTTGQAVVITLSNINTQPDRSVIVSARLVQGNLGSLEMTYTIIWQDDNWMVVRGGGGGGSGGG